MKSGVSLLFSGLVVLVALAGCSTLADVAEQDGWQVAPAPDGRIFFLVGGAVYARAAPDKAPVPLDGNDKHLPVTRMLAFTKHASPLEMLVAAMQQGKNPPELALTAPASFPSVEELKRACKNKKPRTS